LEFSGQTLASPRNGGPLFQLPIPCQPGNDLTLSQDRASLGLRQDNAGVRPGKLPEGRQKAGT
jgi:hypothetical protein